MRHLEENLAVVAILVDAGGATHWRRIHCRVVVTRHVVLVNQVHDDSAGAVRALVLSKIVRAGKLLAALVALKRLVLSVEGSPVALEVFLTAEAAVALVADKGLGGVLGQGLLASTTVGGRSRSAAV